MKKHLIYMGITPENKYRIALFDEANIVTKSIPVKDVEELTDDLKFLNCTVVHKKPVPNLMGAKVLCASETQDARFGYNNCLMMKEKDLRVFPNRKVKYTYGMKKGVGLYKDELLRPFKYLSYWDGMCKDNYFYVIGVVVYESNVDVAATTDNLLCMTSQGDLFDLTNNSAGVLAKAGAVFVQVGTPELSYPNAYTRQGKLSEGMHATVGIPKDKLNKIIWIGKKGKLEGPVQEVEYVWWLSRNKLKKDICDLRSYTKARVFGISGCVSDAKVLILPEDIEDLWLGMFYECIILQAVYIPSKITKIHELGLPKID